jgi:hypothetical protein
MTEAALDAVERTYLASCRHYSPCEQSCAVWGADCGVAQCRECSDRAEHVLGSCGDTYGCCCSRDVCTTSWWPITEPGSQVAVLIFPTDPEDYDPPTRMV